MSDARDALLGRIIEHIATDGLSGTSLRELAESVGTSHRMVLYHFGSRDGLVAAIVDAVEAGQRDALRAIAAGAASPGEIVTTQWAQLSDPSMAPFVRLFFEVAALALFGRPGTASFVDSLVEPWLAVAREAGERLGIDVDPVEVRLAIAVVRGLLLDAVATGDVAGATAALERFVARWERGTSS